MKSFVFISYSRSDRSYVERLATHLESAGLAAWYDYELQSGDRFDQVIARRIDECSAVIVVLTPASAASEWVALELSHARRLGRPIYPLMLELTEMPFLIHNIHYEDVTKATMPTASFLERVAGFTAPAVQQIPAPEKPARRSFGLTARELRIAALIVGGRSSAGIARQLSIPESMVRSHVEAIFQKTGTRNREALSRALGRDPWDD